MLGQNPSSWGKCHIPASCCTQFKTVGQIKWLMTANKDHFAHSFEFFLYVFTASLVEVASE